MANPIIAIAVKLKDETAAGFARMLGSVVSLKNSIFSLGGLIAGLATGAVAAGIAGLVNIFAETEFTLRRLNSALQITGRFSREASIEIQRMAVEMQRTTSTSRQAALDVSKTIAQMAKLLSPTQLAESQKVAIALSETFGISLERAASLIGRTLQGQFNALHRYGIELDLTSNQQDRFNDLMRQMGPLFKVTTDASETLAGRIEQVKNQFTEIQRTVGELIARFAGLNEKTTTVRDFLENLNTKIRANAGEIVQFADRVVRYIEVFLRLLVAAGNLFKVALAGLNALGASATHWLNSLDDTIFGWLERLPERLADGLQRAIDAGITALVPGGQVLAEIFVKMLRALPKIELPRETTNEQVIKAEAEAKRARAAVEQAKKALAEAEAAKRAARTSVDLVQATVASDLAKQALANAEAVRTAAEAMRTSALTSAMQEQAVAAADASDKVVAANSEFVESLDKLKAALARAKAPIAQRVTLAPLGEEGLTPGMENIAGPAEEDPTTTIRRLRAELATVKDEFESGDVSAQDFRNTLHGIMVEADLLLTTTKNLTLSEREQIAAIKASVADAAINELVLRYRALQIEYEAGTKSGKEFRETSNDIRDELLRIARAAGFTSKEIERLKRLLENLGPGKSIIDQIADGFNELGDPIKKANQDLAQMVIAFGKELTKAIADAVFAYESFGVAVQRSIHMIAEEKAKLMIAEMIEDLGMAFRSLALGDARAAGLFFQAAAKHAAAAAAFAIIAEGFGGGGATGGGGGGGAGGARGRSREVSREQGEGTIVIEGTPLASDERFLTELNKSLEKMEGRRIRVIHLPG